MARKSSSRKSSKASAEKDRPSAVDRITAGELRARLRDLDTPIEMIRPYLKVDPTTSRSFAPSIAFDEKLVIDDGQEGEVAVGFFNWISRRRLQGCRRPGTSHGGPTRGWATGVIVLHAHNVRYGSTSEV